MHFLTKRASCQTGAYCWWVDSVQSLMSAGDEDSFFVFSQKSSNDDFRRGANKRLWVGTDYSSCRVVHCEV